MIFGECGECGKVGYLDNDLLCCICAKAKMPTQKESIVVDDKTMENFLDVCKNSGAPNSALVGARHEQTRGKCLGQAREVINGERLDDYGNPEDSFRIIADYWSTYTGVELNSADVAKMMVLFKVARMSGQADKIDNYIDAAGYIGIAGDMV